MPLPPPPRQSTGLPQKRRKSGLRTASDTLQQDYLERMRSIAQDPTVLMPIIVGDEPAAIARLRAVLTKVRDGGSLPFTARFDKGILGALRGVQVFATHTEAARMVDLPIDGQRRFFRLRGHVNRLVQCGVQNAQDPLALMLAYGLLAPKQGLHLWAGSSLWCTGAASEPPQEWMDDLQERIGITLTRTASTWSCHHEDRPRIAHAFAGAAAIEACVACASKDGRLWDHILMRHLCGPRPARPLTLAVHVPGAPPRPVPDALFEAFRIGRADYQRLVDETLRHVGAGSKWMVAGRPFSSAAELVAHLGVPDEERAAAAVLLAEGHTGSSLTASDVLNAHRDRLAAALDTLLPGEGAAFAARLGDTDVRAALRRAVEEKARRAVAGRRGRPSGLGPLGQWIDGFCRDMDAADRRDVLQRVRREVSRHPHPAHMCAFLEAAGFAGEGDRSFSHDQKEAGRAWAPLAAKVLAATGADYPAALREYLEETGSGETAQ